MRVHEIIDAIYTPHKNWRGLTFGQLALLFLTYVLYMRTHRLYGMEEWVAKHQTVLQRCTGWQVTPSDATDDRLARLMEVLGDSDEHACELQQHLGRYFIHAYSLPTEICRYDTTSFNVHHHGDSQDGALLQFGHSKNYRPDLLQFKQGLGTLDPAGIPLISQTIEGNKADDGCYLPAWSQMVDIIGHPDFLYVADCKAAALHTRGNIAQKHGTYLFPLPMTGDVPAELSKLVLNPPATPQDISLAPRARDKKEQERIVGKGFEVTKQMQIPLDDGTQYCWDERWLVTRSDAHGERKNKAFLSSLSKAESQIHSLKPKKDENAAELKQRADNILKRYHVADCIVTEVRETIKEEKKYKGRGRPSPDRPFQIVKVVQLHIDTCRNESIINERQTLAGWRIYVTNVPMKKMSLRQSTEYYRNEWLVERGFHRFKNGSLPVLPLFLKIPERIKGLMQILTITLQALTLIEFVSCRELAEKKEELSGLIPGNPKMKTARPTAERLLARFDNLHLFISETDHRIMGQCVENLNQLQKKILSLLHLPFDIYEIGFESPKILNSS
jgi:transposase